jgi:hypothetical protein
LGHVTVKCADRVTVPSQHLLNSRGLLLVQRKHKCARSTCTRSCLLVR